MKLHEPYIKVGRLRRNIAAAVHVAAADIYVSRNYLKHIEDTHGQELHGVGMDALTFVKTVCNNFNQIRRGSGTSLLLVVYDEKLSKVAAIDLNYSLKDKFWEIKTAEPRRRSAVSKSALLWVAREALHQR